MRTISIFGVGLIGGSFALALRKAGFTGRLIGVSSPRTVEEALRLGIIDEALPFEEAAAASDLIYLSQPIRKIIEALPGLDEHAKTGALITDAGSTKAEIVAAARHAIRRVHFLGGHPMAGKESRGVAAAEPDLFSGCPYVLTPQRPEDLELPLAKELMSWIQAFGARPVVLDAERHDRVVALASHLPQLASTALAHLVHDAPEGGDILRTAGPGLVDMTRLALSPYDVWADILATNQAAVDAALGAYIAKLQEVRSRLAGGSLEQEFRAAADMAARIRGVKRQD